MLLDLTIFAEEEDNSGTRYSVATEKSKFPQTPLLLQASAKVVFLSNHMTL